MIAVEKRPQKLALCFSQDLSQAQGVELFKLMLSLHIIPLSLSTFSAMLPRVGTNHYAYVLSKEKNKHKCCTWEVCSLLVGTTSNFLNSC